MASNRNNNGESNLITLLELTHLKQANQHSQETAQLRTTITELLSRLENQFDVISDKNILEQLVIQLREANQHLVIASMNAQSLQESAEQAKLKQEQFLAMLAHELRNPLAPIVMATELIAKLTASHENLPKLHGILARQVGQLSHLVDDLLDASRISSGRISLYKQEFTLKSIIDNAIEISSPIIALRHQRLECDLPAIVLNVVADFLRLSQVFSNLLINASKFSPEYETISIHVRKHHEKILISIKDHGIGISTDIQQQIFELFSQGYQTVDRAQGGLGIGLALVRSIVDMHEGTVRVRSDGLGLGSEFIVELPLAKVPVTNEAQEPPEQLQPRQTPHLKILIIEDNPDTLAVLAEVLINEGHHVCTALNGHQGIQLIHDAADEQFDLIFCDLGLPNHDGFEIARNIRAILRTESAGKANKREADSADKNTNNSTNKNVNKRPVCLIAYTGYNQAADREHAKDAGFDHFLVKPVATDVLLNLIAGWMST
ncbi:hybrid sensor histidine kinase/response regulator [Undibacterium sp. Ji22W]|uniref:hybrid sensor histidine kinase/response regulator n=1 Tax=Undibacterium sp. Ji22W TaxID=3413038 RepID=UPI003BF09F50